MKNLKEKLKENMVEYVWNAVTYIICGAMVVTGTVVGIGGALVTYSYAGVIYAVILCLGFIAGSFIFAFTVLTISKAFYNRLFYYGLYKDYERRKY